MSRKNLNGHRPLQPSVQRTIHLAHPARPEKRLNLVGDRQANRKYLLGTALIVNDAQRAVDSKDEFARAQRAIEKTYRQRHRKQTLGQIAITIQRNLLAIIKKPYKGADYRQLRIGRLVLLNPNAIN